MILSNPNQIAILAALEHTGRFETPLQLQPVEGGAVNQSFKLISGSHTFFLKCFSQDELLPVDREQAYQVQCQVAEFGYAVKPVFFHPRLGFQVEQWFDVQSHSSESLTCEQQVEVLADCLVAIHSLDVTTPVLNLPEVWQRYLDKSQLHLENAVQEKLNAATQIWQNTSAQDTVLCHNDLAWSHICQTPSITLFDWEYGASGNRFYDLMSCANVNQLNSQMTLALIKRYCEKSALDPVEALSKCEQQVKLVELTNALWQSALDGE